MEFTSPRASSGTPRWCAPPRDVVVGLDFDGTLSPIVEDPDAGAHPPRRPPRCWSSWPRQVARGRGGHRPPGPPGARPRRPRRGRRRDRRRRHASCYVLRPVRQRALDLHQPPGSSRPRPPHGPRGVPARAARGCCAGADAEDAFVEEKGLAVAVHTRRLPDPDGGVRAAAAGARASSPSATSSVVEPGRNGDRGALARACTRAWRSSALVEELDAGGFLFAGDDLGDLEAFEAVARAARQGGMPTLLVCSASEEQSALVELADVVVDGPDGRARPAAPVHRRRPRPARLSGPLRSGFGTKPRPCGPDSVRGAGHRHPDRPDPRVRPRRTPEHRPRPGVESIPLKSPRR